MHRHWPENPECFAHASVALHFWLHAAQDISDRTIQNTESQWARAKSFRDVSRCLARMWNEINPANLNIQLFQNGQLRQNSSTSELIFKPVELVSFISTNLDAAARRRDFDRHAQRHRPDSKRRQIGSADSRTRATGQQREVIYDLRFTIYAAHFGFLMCCIS